MSSIPDFVANFKSTPPVVTAVASPAPNAWIASTSAPVSVNGDVVGFSVVSKAIDNAGNASMVTTTVNIDQVSPELNARPRRVLWKS